MTIEAPIEPDMRNVMNEIGSLIGTAINNVGQKGKYGFVFLTFALGEPNEAHRMNYISNAQRADMLVALKELVANFEGRVGYSDQEH